MGDIWEVDPRELAEKIRGHLIPNMIILSTAAPPCKDHSKIRDAPPGITGQDGSLLQHTVDIELSLRQLLPEVHFETLMENVMPHDDVQSHFDNITDQWGSQPIVCDAADGNMVSRPLLWWNTIHWPEIQQTISTQTPRQLTWEKYEQYDRLYNPIAAHLQPSIHIKEWETPNILSQGGIFHCLTTQAPTEDGRPPPQHANVDQATWDRWQANNKQFPPWQYKPQYLTRHKDSEWTTISPLQRERLMGLPDNFTQNNKSPYSDGQRNTLLGNAWHLPTAIWLLFLLLLPNIDAIPYPPTIPAIDQMTTAWLNNPCPFGPPEKAQSMTHMPQLDWQTHLRWARQQAYLGRLPLPKPIDPTLRWSKNIQQHLDMQTVRKKVIDEIQTLIQLQEEDTTQWHNSLPKHRRIAYKQPQMITQIPVLIQLLHKLQYPHANISDEELSQGFQLLGRLQPGLQWHVSEDNKYKQPQDIHELRKYNREYIQHKLTHAHVDTHWEMMAEEIASEVKSGRMRGPFEAPEWFSTPTANLQTAQQTLHKQHRNPIIAMAFSIQQTGSDGKPKIRRGEDWRRSGHNGACQMDDQPYHHTPDHYLSLAQHLYRHFPESQTVRGHDHDGAYRQLLLRDREVAYVLLQTPNGPTLWHHHVLLFGSAASVWAYNRFGDMLTHISRCLCGIPVLHYVDDYGSINHSRLPRLRQQLQHLRQTQFNPRVSYEGHQSTTTINGTQDTGGDDSMLRTPHNSETMPSPDPAHSYRTPQPFTDRQHDTRTSQTFSRQMPLHHHTPIWPSWQGPSQSTLRQIILNLKQTQYTYQNSHYRTNRDTVTLPAKDTSTITNTHQNDYHLHQRLFLRRTKNMEKQWLDRRRSSPQLRFRRHQRMGGSDLPTRPLAHRDPWGHTSEDLETFYQQPCLHLFSGSLGFHHHTSPRQTTTNTTIHTTMWQRPSDTRNQSIWQTSTTQQSHRITLGMAQSPTTHADTEESTK